LHLVRAFLGTPVSVGATDLSVGLSWGAFIVAAVLSFWGFLLARGEAG
jgi:hypothetical protein